MEPASQRTIAQELCGQFVLVVSTSTHNGWFEFYRCFRRQKATRQPAPPREFLRPVPGSGLRLPPKRVDQTISGGLSFLMLGGVIPATNVGEVYSRFRPPHVQTFQRAGNDLRYRQIAKPLFA